MNTGKNYIKWQTPKINVAQVLPDVTEEERFVTYTAPHHERVMRWLQFWGALKCCSCYTVYAFTVESLNEDNFNNDAIGSIGTNYSFFSMQRLAMPLSASC